MSTLLSSEFWDKDTTSYCKQTNKQIKTRWGTIPDHPPAVCWHRGKQGSTNPGRNCTNIRAQGCGTSGMITVDPIIH